MTFVFLAETTWETRENAVDGAMLGREKLSEFAKRIARGKGAARRRSLSELEDLASRDVVSPLEKVLLGRVLLANFHLRPLPERRAIARFLDVWFVSETSGKLSKRIEVTRLEEIDPETRDSLKVAAITTLPHRELVGFLEDPPQEDLTGGLGLLIALETAYSRLRQDFFPHRHLPALIRALRKARGHRASHIAKPFLWRLEYVLETAMKKGSYLFH
ncbi:MAG: hypothetical protein ACYS47_09255 [Planctomycetota bacterium]|jgi:hypothetical protein